ncbi:MAG: hypothetical protein QOG04_1945 [Actinomycetota bacterium]|jgi:hypothetical protein|nr:hypothetical protein [Actinomycetota bacterium]
MLRRLLTSLLVGTIAVLCVLPAAASATDSPAPLLVGFGTRAITPVGQPPTEWAQYFTPHPRTGVWGEPYSDLDDNGCMSGLNNDNLGPILDGDPPKGEKPEPHVDQPWNSVGDAHRTGGAWSVRGVTIVGDPDSSGKWDGVFANAGFGAKCTLGMHDDTWARAVVLDSAAQTVAMVSLDVVGLFNIEVQRARAEMAIRYPEMNIDQLVVSSTHTHEGVDTMGYWGQLYLNTDGKFPAYQAFIRSQIIDAVHDAYVSREAARVKLAVGAPPVPIRDSRPPIVTDPEVNTAQFIRSDGSTIGTLVNWSNHPESRGSNNQLVSSDFAHGARETLEQELGGTAVYFSGAVGGLQTPLGVDIPGYGSAESWDRTFAIGEFVAESAIDALATTEPEEITGLHAARRQFYMDSDNNGLRALNARGIFDIPTFLGGESWGSEPSGHTEGVEVDEEGSQVKTEMVAVTLDGVEGDTAAVFLTVPGELSPEIELGGYGRPECPQADTGRPFEPVIRDQFGARNVFVLGLGQDELGYIIPGYDFHMFSVPFDGHDGTGPVPVGVNEADTCGEGHYEETVSISSVFAPWVACVAAELAGKNLWTTDPACTRENTHLSPYGIEAETDGRVGVGPLAGVPLHPGHQPPHR